MSARSTFFVAACTFSCFVLGSAQGFAAELLFHKVPPLTVSAAPAYPANLARYHLGAQIEVAPQKASIAGLQLSSKSEEDTNAAEIALLCDDPTVGYALPSGASTLLVSFPKIENIDSISFLNRGAKGHVSIATSSAKLPADSAQWHEISDREFDPDVFKAKIGPGEAKYLRLTFDVTQPGRIAGFGVYSTSAISDFTMPRPRRVSFQDRSDDVALVSNNVSNVHAKARVLYVSSGDNLVQAHSMIDSQPDTRFAFAMTDSSPAAIIDLGTVASLRRISALYSRRQGTMEFYVLPSLPATESASKSLRFDEKTIAELKPIGSVEGDSKGRAAIDFPVTAGRYIMVKWTPATHEDMAFAIAEIAAFGKSEAPSLIAANITRTADREEVDSSDAKDFAPGKDFGDGKDFKDFKEAPEAAPAEGPVTPLPPPPPFVFIPVLSPD